ncbi:MAG: hypothetical protein JW384_02566 [Nitrosomonadaceae bacterium]|nr:hypothetical protein [Nitrosomonadaceae bacterium]
MQKRFTRYVKNLSGMDIGSSKTSKGDPVKSIKDLGLFWGKGLPSESEYLEGTERGYVAMMEWANQQRRKAGAAMRDATPAALPGTTRQMLDQVAPASPVITKAQGGYITKKTKGAKS